MAQAELNFDEVGLDKSSDLFQLYDRLYQGMVHANEVDAPTYPASEDLITRDENGQIVFGEDGNPVLDAAKVAEVSEISASYSNILLKNSAYLFANSILTVMSGGGSSSGTETTGFVSRGGDSMKGALQALYGFSAGVNGQKIFEVSINADETKLGIVYGTLRTTGDANIQGSLLLSNDGISFADVKSIYLNNDTLTIERQNISFIGQASIDGTLTVGSAVINNTGIYWGNNIYYHAGNANIASVDWNMKDAFVDNDLTVNGNATIKGKLSTQDGFDFSVNGTSILYSEVDVQLNEEGDSIQTPYTVLQSDLIIINNHGIKFDDAYILNVRNEQVVSFSAPGMILNLGDSDNGTPTSKISLQADVYDYSNTFKIISKEGAGYFPNGLMARCAVNGSNVLETFRLDSSNAGIVIPQQLRFSTTDGASMRYQLETHNLWLELPYVNGAVATNPIERLTSNIYYAQTTSLLRDYSLDWSATLHFNTSGEFFAFDKPIEANIISIKSEQYKTRLIEDALFFDDGKFIEGVADGLRYSGNGYFNGNISSPSFASGFAGYGWAVKDEVMNGGFHATFDSLTVRKKMRVYELEVQKISCTNGSLWVSDNCSGDEVIAIE